MYKLCKTEQSAQRQRELEISLAELMKIKRYEEITVSDFCAYADIPRKAFYRYFSSKDDALYALLDHTMMEYENFTQPQSKEIRDKLHLGLLSFFGFWRQQKLLLDALEHSGMSGVMLERAVLHMEELSLQKRIFPGETDSSQKRIVRFAFSGLMIMMLNWHREGFRESDREMVELASRILSTGLGLYVSDLLQ